MIRCDPNAHASEKSRTAPMKNGPSLFLAAAITALLLLSSCGGEDRAWEEQLRAHNAVRQLAIEAGEYLIDHPSMTDAEFLDWTRSYATSTNKPAKAAQSVCTGLWVNTNSSDWRASIAPANRVASNLAVVASYKFDGRTCFTGVTLGGGMAKPSAP